MTESTESHESAETVTTEDSHTSEGRRGPTWRGWVFSMLVAIILSVTATLLLGGSGTFWQDRAAAGTGECGSGAGSGNCPHSTARK